MTYRVDLHDLAIMCHGHIDEFRDELVGCRFSDEQPNLLKRIAHPREQDEESNADGSDGIQVPHETISHDGHDQAEDVDHDVVAMVDLDRVRSISHV